MCEIICCNIRISIAIDNCLLTFLFIHFSFIHLAIYYIHSSIHPSISFALGVTEQMCCKNNSQRFEKSLVCQSLYHYNENDNDDYDAGDGAHMFD